MNSTDLFVIGGGPAGLAAAIAARQRGLRVVVADGMRPPIDKACGEGLMPDGLAALERLGLRLTRAEAYPFRGIRFLTHHRSSDALFPAGQCGLAARRTVLHRVMSERAAQVGTELLWGATVTGISDHGVHVAGNFVRARWIVGADGSNSRVRRWAGLEASYKPRLRYAFRQHYRVAPWTDHMEVHWGRNCQGYATPVSENQVCIVLASHDPHMRLEQGLADLPGLRARIEGAAPATAEQGAVTGNRRLKRVWRGNVALIGDAAGTVDAITGEGLGLAFNQAVSLAKCLESDDLSPYQAEHRRLAIRPLLMARLMLILDGRTGLQDRTLRVFQKRPQIFRRLLALHVGAVPAQHLVWDGLTLGWGLLTA
ncbi:MAG TPA: NAD(P)/FAD-dependent oxidoreductase [Candidatus Sulfotelmatobacter sp.]|nr:NAD(P)/FAD-dependent oxidoreductase [Candidatus Sulfotelmatobacter sp.]